MESRSYSDFSMDLHQRVRGRRLPINGTIEVTRRCNLTCAHCYNNLPLGDRKARISELTYEDHRQIIDQITEAGCLWLLYTGGEIFARSDFLDIYTYAKQKGLLVTLFTNGTLIGAEIADYLTQWRPFSIEITLYGRKKETYEGITGIPGSYERCLNGIHLLMERRLPVKLKTMVLTVNQHEIQEIKRFVEDDLGLEFRFDATINARIDHCQKPLTLRLTPEEITSLDTADTKRTAEWKRFSDQFNGPVHSAEHWDELYHCGGGIHAFAIDPYGKMGICVLSAGDKWDLRKGTFQQGWENFLSGVRQRKITRVTRCVSCEIKAMCGMCPANADLEKKDSEEPVDFMCRVAHLRAKALDFPVKPHGECDYCHQDRVKRTEG